MGGGDLDAVGRCIFAMRVTDTCTFDEYWCNPDCRDKRSVRNGSKKMLVGDNIYHHDSVTGEWLQEDSHHSHPDGGINSHNLQRDISRDRVLLSRYFLYFGAAAPEVPPDILAEIGFVNRQGHRKYDNAGSARLLTWLHQEFGNCLNQILGDPSNFDRSSARYSVQTDRVS